MTFKLIMIRYSIYIIHSHSETSTVSRQIVWRSQASLMHTSIKTINWIKIMEITQFINMIFMILIFSEKRLNCEYIMYNLSNTIKIINIKK